MVEFIPEGHAPFPWESQASQFNRYSRETGVVYERHHLGVFPDHRLVECLLYYRPIGLGERGCLTGILYYYPNDIQSRDGRFNEKAGNVNIFIDPAFQMRGYGRKLVEEAVKRWPSIDPEQQRYSQDGYKFRLALEGKSRWD